MRGRRETTTEEKTKREQVQDLRRIYKCCELTSRVSLEVKVIVGEGGSVGGVVVDACGTSPGGEVVQGELVKVDHVSVHCGEGGRRCGGEEEWERMAQ